MGDLVAFLLARITEDEVLARAAADASSAHWVSHQDGRVFEIFHAAVETVDADGFGDVIVYDEGSPRPAEAAHIARHDPARVLAECKIKRDLVDGALLEFPGTGHGTGLAELLIKDLASLYSTHPDYRKEWRP